MKVLKSFYNIIISLFSWIIYNTAQSVCCIPCMYTSGQQSFNDFDFFCVHHHFILKIRLIYAKLWEAHMLIYETMKPCCFKCETFCSMLHWHPNHVWDECVEYFTVYLSGTQFSHTRHSCLFVRLDLSFHTHTHLSICLELGVSRSMFELGWANHGFYYGRSVFFIISPWWLSLLCRISQ